MKPQPFSSLNHLTLPTAISMPPLRIATSVRTAGDVRTTVFAGTESLAPAFEENSSAAKWGQPRRWPAERSMAFLERIELVQVGLDTRIGGVENARLFER